MQMIRTLRADPAADFCLVPVAVYWGRAPQHEASWWRLLLAEDWVLTSRLRKLLQVLFNGRDTLVEFDAPLSLRELLGAELAATTRGWRVARSLHALYARRRAVRIGPDLSHRRTLVNAVLRTRAVRAAVTLEMRTRRLSRRKAMLRARADALEIAANYSHVFVRFMEHALAWLWNRLYDGVEFGHAATLEQVAEGHELIYVPCHRSHMDYLLLSYAIYVQGFAVPHVAGGVNLNLPLIGRLLRKGGAFFIRRTLRGDTLYASRAHEVSRHHHGARAPDRVLHRRWPQPHRAAAAAEDRHALDDGARLPARAACARWCSSRSTSGTSAWRRAAPIWASSPGSPRRKRACSGC